MKEREDIFFDFGFTAEDEEDIIAKSEIKYELHATEEQVLFTRTALDTMNTYVHSLYDRIIPLLNNLAKDADKKPIINWPNRKQKIAEFQTILEKIVKEADKLKGDTL